MVRPNTAVHVGVYAGSLRPGGGLTVLRTMVNGLSQYPDIHVTVFSGAADSASFMTEMTAGLDNVSHRTFFPGVSSGIRYLFSKTAFVTPRILGTNFDVVVSFNYFLPSYCGLIVVHLNLLSFLEVPWSAGSLGVLKRLDARTACRKADLNIFESRFLLNAATEAVRAQINNPTVSYVGLDPEFRVIAKSVTESEGWENNSILLVSSTQAHKDNSTCLRAVAALVAQRPDVSWHLTVVGGQSSEQWLRFREEARDLGISSHTTFLGPVSKARLRDLFRRSLCSINASRVESFSMVALESMACGCPPIVVRATAIPESVGDAGVLVEPGSATQFASAILAFHENEEFRNAYVKAGFRHASNFSGNRFVQDLKDGIQSVRRLYVSTDE